LLVISSSGRSPNLVKAIRAARKQQMFSIGLLGKEGGPVGELTDVNIIIPSNETTRIQEVQLHVLHMLGHLIEQQIGADDNKTVQMPEEWPMGQLHVVGRSKKHH
jgi:DNA-binding MurR/RpiR family transcriptional regulator